MRQKVKQKMVKTSLRLPARLWKATRLEAMKRQCDAQVLVAEALEQYLPRYITVRVQTFTPETKILRVKTWRVKQ